MIAIMTTSQNWGKKKQNKKNKKNALLWSKYGDINSFSSSFFSLKIWRILGISGKSEIRESCLGSNLPQTDLNPTRHLPRPRKNPPRCDEIALGRRGSTHRSATVVGRKLRLAKSRHTREKHFCLWARRERTHLQEFSSSAFARLV